MKSYKGIAISDGLSRNNQYMPLRTLLNAYDESPFIGLPSNAAHDSTRLIGWTFLDGIYIEPGKAYVINDFQVPENDKDYSELKNLLQYSTYKRYVEGHKDEIEQLKGLLGDKLSLEASIAPVNGVAYHDEGILYRVFPEFKPKDKKDTKALTNINNLPACEKYIPGVFKIGDFIVYADQYFRRNCAIVNSLNNDFLSRLLELRDNTDGLDVKIKLDPDLIGLAGTESAEMEYQYWFGPKFTDDLKNIPNGVTRHNNEKYDNFYTNVVFTDFGWYEQDGNKTLECEEVEDRVNIKDGNKRYCGCRYVHSFLNTKTGLPTHLDGAIRAYDEEQIIERLDEKIDKAGRNTFYTKLWRIDGDMTIKLWKELITHYFRDNQLVGEYLGGKDNKLEEFIAEDKKQEDVDPVTEYIPIQMHRGDGLRLFYSKWTPESYQDSKLDYDVLVKSYETVNLKAQSIPVIEAETVTIEKALRKAGLCVSEYTANNGGYKRIFHLDQVYNFPVFVCKSADVVSKVIFTLMDFCKSWNKNGDNRIIAFSVAGPFKDYYRQIALAGHVDDFVNVYENIGTSFPEEKGFYEWIQNFYELNNQYPEAKRNPRPNSFISASKELYFRRRSVSWDKVQLDTENHDIKLATNFVEGSFLKKKNIKPVPVLLINKSKCKKCGGDYANCKCISSKDGSIEEITDAQLLELTWTDRSALD